MKRKAPTKAEAELDGIRGIIMKVLTRHLSLESEMRTLRAILDAKGIISYAEFNEAEDAVRQLDQELHERAGQSQTEVLEELLRKFQGTKQ
jgi:hypothetical protein